MSRNSKKQKKQESLTHRLSLYRGPSIVLKQRASCVAGAFARAAEEVEVMEGERRTDKEEGAGQGKSLVGRTMQPG